MAVRCAGRLSGRISTPWPGRRICRRHSANRRSCDAFPCIRPRVDHAGDNPVKQGGVMNAKLLSTIGIGSALCLAVPTTASADTNTLFILDGSNSMWGQVEQVAKIETARSVLEDLLGDVPSDTNVGLMTYGHSREGDCSDVEVLSPIGQARSESLTSHFGAIVPRGKSPIALALEMSAREFTIDQGDNNNVVLISDGVETCGRDICKAAADLAAQDINVRIHVVGFDVGADERKQLECVANVGGGQYFHATSTEGFQHAVAKVQQAAVTTPQPNQPADAKEPVSVVVDKAHLMRLDKDASVVMVANPTIADVAIESPRMVFIVGREPGETNIFVLDSNGNEIVQSDLVVVPKPDRHVTVHRITEDATEEATLSCAPRCAEVVTSVGTGSIVTTLGAAGTTGSRDSDDSDSGGDNAGTDGGSGEDG